MNHSLSHFRAMRNGLGSLLAMVLILTIVPTLAWAQPLLLDPATQPKFVNDVPDAMAPGFMYTPTDAGSYDYYEVGMYPIQQDLGLVDPVTGAPMLTDCWGYGTGPGFPNATYPGRTFEARAGRQVRVQWSNNLTENGDPMGTPVPHLLPVDTSLHWAFALPGYQVSDIDTYGVPVVPHLHGGHTEWQSDGNPEFFFTPGSRRVGPRFVKDLYTYDNSQQAGTLWYHDHGLGITRLNVYAGLAGFYILRDDQDTGDADNPLGLPVWPYEQALVIQDHMFTADGQHFYPSMPGDPLFADFIAPGQNVPLPTALAEFFGDFILVNGKVWPKMEVEPRLYRFRLLNGSDSRVYKMWFAGAGDGVSFTVIGNDDGLLAEPTRTNKLVIAPGERYDVLVDFSRFAGRQIIVKNNARGPYPAGDTVDAATAGQIMAFNVGTVVTDQTNNAIPATLRPAPITTADILQGDTVANTRRLALYEGMDNYGRLQPLLGTAEPTVDVKGGIQDGSLVWDECQAPITENPGLDDVEIWEVYNTTGDAHPFHVHLVSFQILDRQRFKADILPKDITQHDGTIGLGFSMANIQTYGNASPPDDFEAGWKDTAIMYPGEVTRIMARFDRPGRYVYHCHILSHEDHEMMRPYHVGPWDEATDMTPCHGTMMAGAAQMGGAQAVRLDTGELSFDLSPNPFNPRTEFSFKLPVSSRVSLVVYDVRGRAVKTLVSGEQSAGAYSYTWNGYDDHGGRVASGTYFARLETGVGSMVRKVVMLK